MRRVRTITTSLPSTATRFATVGALAAATSVALAFSATAETDDEIDDDTTVRTVTVSADDVVAVALERAELADALTEALEARTELTATAPPPPPPPPEPEPEPEPSRSRSRARAASGPVSNATWDRVAQCESGGNWSINTGNGYYGGLQFNIDSWRWVGGSGYPHEASKAEQIHRANLLWERQGWNAWPSCSRQLGLR
jgi:hypothetical protein